MAFPLPQELIDRVAFYVADADLSRWNQVLKSFRLTCKAFAAAGVQYLTPTVSLSTHPYDLRRLSDIAQHPCISKHVTLLVCDDSRYSTESLDNPDLARLLCVSNETQEEAYRQLLKDQLRVRRQGLDLATLCSVLPKMPRLQSIEITDRCNAFQGCHATPVYASPSHSHEAYPEMWPEASPSEDLWDQIVSPYHTFITAIRGLPLTSHKVHKLVVRGRDVGTSHRIFDAGPEDREHLYNVFRDLRDMRLQITTHNEEQLWREKTMGSGLIGNLLAQATALEALELSQHWNDYTDYVLLDISSVLDQILWSRLRHFSLSGFSLEGHAGLAKFFVAHGATLKSVELILVDIRNGSWHEVMAGLKRGGVLWEKCCLDGLTDERYIEREIVDNEVLMFLRNEGANPFDVYS